MNYNAPLPIEPKEGYLVSSKFVISSVYDPNQVLFIVTTEYKKKDGSGYETYFERYKYKDNGIVKVSSFRIPHEKNVRVKLVRSSFAEPELIATFYTDINGKQKLIGTTIYKMDVGELIVKDELFK
ncbi:hypothetical protein [Ammoniphilus sp. 3BR4]|uniref:hypothetical protein n=1 Tax=Ammoniphilus sp. 3BR4 TaxID=3158265 RepID=UPI003466CB26